MGFNGFSTLICLLEVAIIILYGTCTSYVGWYSNQHQSIAENPNEDYNSPSDITSLTLFVLVGFAYLLVTSARYSWSSIGYTLLFVATTILLSPLWDGFWKQCQLTRLYDLQHGWDPIPLNTTIFVRALYTAATVIIAWGAIGGRASAGQSLWIVVTGVAFATANMRIQTEIQVLDVGGSMHVHIFGAAFGLATSFALFSKSTRDNHTSQARTRATGAFGLLGTLILFLAYPAFNSAELLSQEVENLAPANAGYDATFIHGLQVRAYLNTLTGISASVMAAFFASRLSGTKFAYHHIQTATITGGAVNAAIGPFMDNPYGTMTAGAITAIVSVSILNLNLLKSYDATGVHAVHLIPGIFGSIGSAIAAARIIGWNYAKFDAANQAALIFNGRSALEQGGHQMAFGCISLGFGILAGLITGVIANIPLFGVKTDSAVDDMEEWELTDPNEIALSVTSAVAPKTMDPSAGPSEPVPA